MLEALDHRQVKMTRVMVQRKSTMVLSKDGVGEDRQTATTFTRLDGEGS